MPARQPRPTRSQDPEYLAELGGVLLAMTDTQRREFLAGLDRDNLEVAERALAARIAVSWRATPATMAHYLEPESFELYDYWRLLGELFAGAFRGTDEPHQQWWVASQYGKTSLMANWGPVWALDMNPRLRLMYVSYDADKAVEEVGKARDIAERHYGHLRFRLRPDKRARGMWSTPQGGGLYAVGINGAIVGYPADGMLLDDLLKGWVEAHSPATRNRVWSIYRSQIRMRMQSETCPILCAGTRWHMDDVQARLLQLEEAEPAADHWKVTRLATVAEAPNPASSDPILRLPDPLGREVGQVLEPRRFSEREVATRFATLGSYLAGSLEQQRPSPEEGGEIKRGWFRIAAQLPDHADDWLSSTDPKLKDKESGDFVVVQVWARTGKDYWLVDQLRGQWSQAMTINAICLLSVRHPQVRRHVIENTGNGPEVMETLRTAMPDYVISEEMRSELGMTTEEAAAVEAVRHRGLGGLIPNTPRGSKSVRMRAVSPLIEAGDVHLPDPTRVTWVAGLLDELAAFGSGSGHDDQCDALSQALSRLSHGTASVASPASAPLPTGGPSVRTGARFGVIPGARVR